MTKRYMSTIEFAEYIGIQPQTARKWRLTGMGPKYIRWGKGDRGRAVYDLADIEIWAESRKSTSTSSEAVALAAQGGSR